MVQRNEHISLDECLFLSLQFLYPLSPLKNHFPSLRKRCSANASWSIALGSITCVSSSDTRAVRFFTANVVFLSGCCCLGVEIWLGSRTIFTYRSSKCCIIHACTKKSFTICALLTLFTICFPRINGSVVTRADALLGERIRKSTRSKWKTWCACVSIVGETTSISSCTREAKT